MSSMRPACKCSYELFISDPIGRTLGPVGSISTYVTPWYEYVASPFFAGSSTPNNACFGTRNRAIFSFGASVCNKPIIAVVLESQSPKFFRDQFERRRESTKSSDFSLRKIIVGNILEEMQSICYAFAVAFSTVFERASKRQQSGYGLISDSSIIEQCALFIFFRW